MYRDHLLSLFFCGLYVNAFRDGHSALNNQYRGSSLEEANSVLLCLGMGPMKMIPSYVNISIYIAIFQSCLCSHDQDRLLHCRLPGILALTIFLLLFRAIDAGVVMQVLSAGAGLFTIF